MTKISLIQDRFRGAVLGAALGDALGAPFEGSPPLPDLSLADLSGASEVLRYTDDTHMMIGLAESLLACGGFDGDHLVRTFARNYEEEPWRGYGAGPPMIFRMIASGTPWLQAAGQLFGGAGSFGNGAAMRVAPCALFAQRSLEKVAELARQSASVTHTHQLGVDGAIAVACGVAVIISLHDLEPLTPERLLSEIVPHLETVEFVQKFQELEALGPDAANTEVVQRLGNGIEALHSVPTAFAAFQRTPDRFDEVVRFAVSLGGDTDTIACMAGALAGARAGESGLPTAWRSRLENVATIRRFADALYHY